MSCLLCVYKGTVVVSWIPKSSVLYTCYPLHYTPVVCYKLYVIISAYSLTKGQLLDG